MARPRKPISRDGQFRLDELDRAILSELRENALVSYRELSLKVGARQSTCQDRIEKMELNGYFKYTITFDQNKTKMKYFAYILIRSSVKKYDDILDFGDYLSGIQNVIMCDHLNGQEWDIILKIGFCENEEINILQREIENHRMCADTAIIICKDAFRHYEISVNQLV